MSRTGQASTPSRAPDQEPRCRRAPSVGCCLLVVAMRSQVEFALAHPVFDPGTQIVAGHFWACAPGMSAGLTCNIGLE